MKNYLGALLFASVSSMTVMISSTPAIAQVEESKLTGRIPVAEFVKKANMRSPRISPDGTKLAYFAGKDGKELLVLLDLSKPNDSVKPILKAEEARESGDRSMVAFRWVGNKHIVMTIQSREDLGGGVGDFGRLVAYDLDSGKLIQQAWEGAAGNASTILYIDHDSGNYLLQRTSVKNSQERWDDPEVVKVDVSTGKYTIEQRTNPVVRAWSADSKGVIRAGYGSDKDSGKFRMMYRSNGKEQFKTVYNLADSTFSENPPAPEIFIEGTDMAYAMSRKDGYTKVYKVNMTNMELSDPIYEKKGFDLQDLISSDDGGELYGYQTFDGENRTVYLNADLKLIQEMMEETFGKDQASIVDYSKNFEKVIIYVGGTKKNGGFYLFDTINGNLRLINWRSSMLKETPLNPVKAEWYTASDGLKIQAIVTYPRHRKQKNLPVIVMPHGGPFGVMSSADRPEPWNQPLAEAGYIVIQPNYRGSGGYGKEFEKEGRKSNGYGVRMQDDLNDILTHYGKLGIIDPNRACIMGWSYGGYAAARGAQRDANIWKCAIAGAGVYDFPMMTAWDKKNLGKFSSGFQATSDDPIGISSARNTDGKWAPILIVAGLRDVRIPIEQSRTLVSRLKGSGKKEGVDFRYIEQPQGTHNLPFDDVHIQFIEESEAWLKRFNPAYIPSDPDKAPPVAVMAN